MLLALKTIWRRNRPRTRASLKTTFAGLLVTVAALLLPAPEQRSARVERR
jgi:uncharacterized membrane protein